MSTPASAPASASAPVLLVTGPAAAAQFFVNDTGKTYAEYGYTEADIDAWHVRYEHAVSVRTRDRYANGVTAAPVPVHAVPPVLTGAGAGAHAVSPSLTATSASSPLKRGKGEDGNVDGKKKKAKTPAYKGLFENAEAQRAIDREEFKVTIEAKDAEIKLLQGRLAASLGVQAEQNTKLQTLMEVREHVTVLTQMNLSLQERLAQAMGAHDVAMSMLKDLHK